MPLQTRRRIISAKIEATAGTAETLDSDDSAILGFDVSADPNIEMEDRAPVGLVAGQYNSTLGVYEGTYRLSVELRGSGTAYTLPLWAETLLLASGLEEGTGGVLTPVSTISDQSTATVSLWEDGVKKTIYGSMCNAVIRGSENGKRMMVEFTGMGIWGAPVDASAPTPTHETAKPIRMASSTLTLDSDSSNFISRFEFDLGQDIKLRSDISKAAGAIHAYATGNRQTRLKFDPERNTVTNDDVFGDFLAGTERAAIATFGGTQGNRVVISAPRLQFRNPKTQDRDGLSVYDVECQCNALAGDDEFTISFT